MDARKKPRKPQDPRLALRRSEERFQTLIDLSSEWYWEQDEECRFTSVTGSAAGHGGIDPKGFVGTLRWDRGAVPVGDDGSWDKHKALLKARQPFTDFLFKRPDSRGGMRYISTSGQPLFDSQGRFGGYRGIAKDITESRRAEELQTLEHSVAQRISAAESVTSAMTAVIRAICETEGWECGQYFRPDHEAGVLRLGASWGIEDSAIQEFIDRARGITYEPGAGLVGKVWQSGQPLWVADVTKDPRALRSAFTVDLGIRGRFVFPVRSDRKVISVLAFSSRRIRQSEERLLKAILVIGSQIGQFLQRKRAEEEQLRFRAAMDASADMITLVDRQTMRYVDVNAAACEMHGYSREQMLQMGPADFSTLGKEQLERSYDETIADGTTTRIESYQHRKDGTSVPTEVLRRAVRSGERWIIVAIVRDISERRRAEQLRELEHAVNNGLANAESDSAALKSAIRAICESLGWDCGRYYLVDEKADMLRFGEAWGVPEPAIQQFLEQSRGFVYRPGAGLMGKAWQSGQPMWVADVTKDARALPVGLGIRSGFFFPIVAEGKTIGMFAFNSRQVREPEERLLQAIRVIGSQIGQYLRRKQAEEDLRRFRVAMDNSADMIVLIDRATMRFVDVNETSCRLLGYSREELLKMGPHDVLPTSREELERAYDEFIANPSRTSGMHSYYRRKDGSTFPFESTRHVLRSGDAYIIAAISRDISERLASENALRESESRFRSLTHLSSDMYWEQDEKFRFTSMSGTGSDRVNVQSFPMIGKKRWEQNYINMAADQWAEHIALLEAHKPFRDMELCRLDESGRKVWISISGEPVVDSSGAFKGYRGVGKDITERKADEARIQYLAHHDGLTNLPNRVMFSELLNHTIHSAQRHRRNFAVLFIDLDRFKIINDSLGHEAGDALLKEMSLRLKGCLRASDLIARLGGDEFVVLIEEVVDPNQAATVARKILSASIKPIVISGQECRVTASIGICLYPADAEDEQSLMKNADIAMYHAKEEGKNNYQFYSRDIKAQSLERLTLETNLRRALERDEFSLHYQAKVNLKTGAITGVEALLRWQNVELGTMSPLQFIPLAEETGLIVPIGKWVLRTACAQNVAWQRDGLPPVCIAVNLSVRQFASEELVADIATALADSGMSPELLELEITEGMVIHDPERAIKLLTAIKKLGVRLAIDDFGTGYSSLGQLKHFPIDTLKVDRSFIREIPRDAEDKAITEAIIAMGKTLGLTIVAEGVETKEQQTFLREHFCDEMQGFYFSKPVTSGEFAELLRRHGNPSKP